MKNKELSSPQYEELFLSHKFALKKHGDKPEEFDTDKGGLNMIHTEKP
jgi:hypothetical protein